MKGRFWPYLGLQFKRAAHFLPYILGIGVLLLAAVGAYAAFAGSNYDSDDSRSVVEIGLVGEIKEPYFDAMLYTVNHLDDLSMSLYINRMDEKTAFDKLNSGQISAVVLVPEGFEDRMNTDDPLPLTYVVSPTSTGLWDVLTDEIIHTTASLLCEGQNVIIGMRRYGKVALPGSDRFQKSTEMVEDFVRIVLRRSNLFEVRETGIVAGQNFVAYLMSSLSAFYLLVWGVACAPFFSARRNEIHKILSSAGLGPAGQLAAEYLAYFFLLLVGTGVSALLAGVVLRVVLPDFLPMLLSDFSAAAVYFLRLTLVAAVFAALHFLLYELSRSTVAAILTQTLAAIAMGYVSGCFYSAEYFPAALQRVGSLLPPGAAMRFLAASDGRSLLVLSGYFVLFAALMLVKRRREMAGDAL